MTPSILRGQHRRIIDNFLSLSTLQLLNLLLPLLTFPYLSRILGPDKFGMVAFAQVLAVYGSIIAEYGFPFTATRRVAVCRNDSKALSELFFSVSTLRMIFAATALLLFILLTAALPRLRSDTALFLLAWISVAGTALMPGWFFQGIERMKALAVINAVPRIFFTMMVFVTVHSEQDYRLVPALGGIGAVIAAGISLFYLYHNKLVGVHLPSRHALYRDAKEGFPIFVSTLAASIYAVSNTTILGFTTTAAAVAWYAGAERVLRIGLSFLQSFSQAIFPRMGITAHEDGMYYLAGKIRKLFIPGLMVTILAAGVLAFAAPLIVSVLMGAAFAPAVIILQILSPVIPLVFMGILFGIQSILPLGRTKSFSAIMIAGAVFDILLCLILVPRFQHIGAAIAWTSTECIVVVIMVIFLHQIGFFTKTISESPGKTASQPPEVESHIP